ncbi:MAG TPA: SDR family oxidoreductase [Gammaproteobacteria bacterium]|nr:SDR family oxidoreductase [Gammaproteobacteria bacterium]
MDPEPVFIKDSYRGSAKLQGKVALITGGDSGIGRAIAVHFAREGAQAAIVYLNETKDAADTRMLVERENAPCLLIRGDVGDENFCRQAVQECVNRFGRLDILVNNAAEQHPRENPEEISAEQIENTFRTNVYGYFFMAREALKHLGEGGVIINTTSVTAYRGSETLVDYSATKGAITAFTRSLAKALVSRGIRVNGVAPGPIWTPLIPSTFSGKRLQEFGKKTPMGRAGQPAEVAPSYVFLASEDASYIAGQIIHPNGGEIVNT